MKDKWTAGPKFNAYLTMNFHLVAPQYVFSLVLSCVGLGIAGYLLLLSALSKLYSQTLYHKQACLYQSVPVSSFETVFVKTLVGTVGFLIPPAGSMGLNLLQSLLDGSRLEVYEWIKAAGLMLHVPEGVVVYMLSMIATGFLICGIALFGVAVGNRVRGNREKRPNAATAILVIAGLCLVVYGVYWMMHQIPFSNPLLREVISLLLQTAGAGFFFWLNVRAMDKWYSV